jgi:hypothetical protein
MERPKAYLLETSKSSISIDADEISKVMKGIETNRPIVLRQGIFNPSYFVAIKEDRDRISEYLKLTSEIGRQNEQAEKYGAGTRNDIPEFKKLRDIFSDVKLLK